MFQRMKRQLQKCMLQMAGWKILILMNLVLKCAWRRCSLKKWAVILILIDSLSTSLSSVFSLSFLIYDKFGFLIMYFKTFKFYIANLEILNLIFRFLIQLERQLQLQQDGKCDIDGDGRTIVTTLIEAMTVPLLYWWICTLSFSPPFSSILFSSWIFSL